MSKIKIIICDDHALILDGLKKYFEVLNDIEVVATAASLTALKSVLEQTTADVLVLDVQLPEGNSTEVCGSIKKSYPKMSIVALSYLKERNTILRMIQEGASAYLIKTSSMHEIELSIREVHSGGIYYCKEAQMALTNFHKDLPTVMSLSKREKEILKLIAEGLSAVEIAQRINISPQTVDTHRKNMMRKLEVHKIVSLIQKAKDLALI